MDDALPAAARRYRGASPDERRAERRTRLLAAAIREYGERGYRQASVKSVCEAAGLTERYFYESFANSEALLVAALHAVSRRLQAELLAAAEAAGRGRAARGRAMLRAYFEALRRDPRSARVFLVEIRGVSPAVTAAVDEVEREVGRLVARVVAPADAPEDGLLEAGVVGAVVHVALRWIAQDHRPDLDTVTDTAMRLARALVQRPGAAR